MRILQVVVRFSPYVGGVENTVLELSRGLTRRGHPVTVLCADEPRDAPAQVEGVEVRRLPWFGKIGNTNLCPSLWSVARQLEADVIHAHLPPALFADAAASAARRTGAPLVVTYNNDLSGPGVKGLLGHVYSRTLLQRTLAAAAAVVVSHDRYRDFSPHLRKVRDKVRVIPWGVDVERFRPTPLPEGAPPTFSFLSILDEHHRYKGLDELLQALRILAERGLTARLLVGGVGPESMRYRQLAAELGVAERVEFLGFVPDDRLPEFFHRSRAFVLPSLDARQEGFGLVALEAMASGRPVVASEVIGTAERIREAEAGFLVPPGDVTALADALERCLADGAKLRAMGERGRRLAVDRYSWSAVVDGYLSLYRDLMGSSCY